ncbi:hypothetical protein [Thermocatellispora tengchongensis]
MGEDNPLWDVVAFVPLLFYGAVPAVALAFTAHWLSTRIGRPRIGRVSARTIAATALVAHGVGPLAFLVDVAGDSRCLFSEWGGPEGASLLVGPNLAATAAALCVFSAVRRPRHRLRTMLRRLARARWFRRTGAVAAALAVLGLVPTADLGSGPIAAPGSCPPTTPGTPRVPIGEQAFLCAARQGHGFDAVPDHALLAYGRAQCAAYPRVTHYVHAIASICPPAAADVLREITAQEAAYARREAAAQAICDRSRHRPRIKPVLVAHVREFSEIGMEAYEDHEDSAQEVSVMHGDLVGSAPGHLSISFSPEYEACVTTEVYRRRPPVEVKGWDQVIEVGYHSPTGDFVLRDPMAEPELPNLAVAGKGHYRVRVHYREPDWDAFTPQHLLIMIYPGRGDQVIDLKRAPS